MFGSSCCQILNVINLWRAVSVIYLLYNSSINRGVTANKNIFINHVQTLSQNLTLVKDDSFWTIWSGCQPSTQRNKQQNLDVNNSCTAELFGDKWAHTFLGSIVQLHRIHILLSLCKYYMLYCILFSLIHTPCLVQFDVKLGSMYTHLCYIHCA